MNQEKIIELCHRLRELFDHDQLSQYWPGLNRTTFALYNEQRVFVVNQLNEVVIGERTSAFMGNTVIQYEGEQIAIWDLSTVLDEPELIELYAGLVHEMFHAFQIMNQEKRWANEMLGFQYPFHQEMVALRLKERQLLYQAIHEESLNQKKQVVAVFIHCREQRASMISDFIQYEYAIESIEGAALYVESNVLLKHYELNQTTVRNSYLDNLLNRNELCYFRESCYYLGLGLALLLDQISPNWQSAYMNQSEYLYEFFKLRLKLDGVEVETYQSSDLDWTQAESLIEQYRREVTHTFESFQEKEGYKITLVGNLRLTGLDPMNILALEDLLLHQRFVKVNGFSIQTETLQLSGESCWVIKELQFYSKEKPLIFNNVVYTSESGEITGNVKKSNEGYIIEL